MKTKFITINKPCDEKWENMTPNEKGSYCDSCSKDVIDFTRLTQLEISEIMKKSNGNICARLTKTQLNSPIFYLEEEKKKVAFPYSNIAAGLILATSLVAGFPANAKPTKVETVIVTSSNIDIISKSNSNKPKAKKSEKRDFTIFEGKILSEVDSLPVENVIISFCTLNELISTYSNKDGSFSLKIPNSIIDNDNVVKLLYHESRERSFYYNDDYILSKDELNEYFLVKERTDIILLGKIAYRPIPLVFYNAEQIDFDEFEKAFFLGEKSSFSKENKEYYYFETEAAIAIYGEEAKDGLYIVTQQTIK